VHLLLWSAGDGGDWITVGGLFFELIEKLGAFSIDLLELSNDSTKLCGTTGDLCSVVVIVAAAGAGGPCVWKATFLAEFGESAKEVVKAGLEIAPLLQSGQVGCGVVGLRGSGVIIDKDVIDGSVGRRRGNLGRISA